MEELAMVLEESRLNVSKALNNLQDRGLVELKRKEIVIPALERLIYEKDK
jgi:predicted transcriptional regulator